MPKSWHGSTTDFKPPATLQNAPPHTRSQHNNPMAVSPAVLQRVVRLESRGSAAPRTLHVYVEGTPDGGDPYGPNISFGIPPLPPGVKKGGNPLGKSASQRPEPLFAQQGLSCCSG